jgi:uncharacterized protein YndB with AHSA1/START domain
MTTPNVPLRLELRVELPGTPEQVWHAIATGEGLTSWMFPTEVEPHVGGAYVAHMGETSSTGSVTGWEPTARFAIEEPDWAALTGHEGAPVTPLATEFLIEASSGGTCVLRVVSSAFGTGAEWEREFFEEMERFWQPAFEHLALYLTHFPGQHASVLETGTDVAGTAEDAVAMMRDQLGITAAGQRVDLNGLAAEIAKVSDIEVIARLTAPGVGYVALYAVPIGEGKAYAGFRGYFFGDAASGEVARHEPTWRKWFENLPARAA